jgi:cobalt-zinc-cadmium efflux system membrane fusion protein
MTSRHFTIATACAVAFSTGGCKRASDSADAPAAKPTDGSRVTVDSAQRSRFRVETFDSAAFSPVITTTGTVAFSADRSTQVLAPMSGPVSRIFVNPGARVAAGEPLAAVASADFATAIASYRKADAAWRNAKRIADLDEQLFTNDALARRELDQARTDLAGAVADKEAALQQLKSLGVDDKTLQASEQGRSTGPIEALIRAPISGTLVEKLISPGQLLQAGTTPCFTIADLSSVWVMASVFERDIRSVHRGDLAVVTTDASPDSLKGVVDYVAALVDPSTRATAVRLIVPNKGEILKRDMLVQVSIRSKANRKGLLVPVAAVLRDDENLPYLFVAMPDGSFARRRIGLGSRVDGRYEVTSGLAARERVVVDGALFLPAAGHQ